jgi:hypothetical protein
MDAASHNFHFHTPVTFFEKADAPEGFRRRIGGLVSTDGKDQEEEVVLQDRLDFSHFLNKGYYNDNHAKHQTGVLGFPDHVQYVKKGSRLPDGTTAPNNGHWAEGYLLEGWEPAEKIWQLGQALKKTGGRRRLGYSIEGAILRRAGANRKTIAEALVKHVAITHCPVNTDTGMSILAKSLQRAEEEEKALSVGAGSAQAPVGARTGEGAGAILTPESLEHDIKPLQNHNSKQLTKAEAVAWILSRYPKLSAGNAGRFVDASLALRERGLL